LPSETMIWQPEFTDKTLSRKPGAVQVDDVRSLPTPCDIDCKESKSVTVFIHSCEYLTFSVCWAKKHRKIWSRHAKQN
ncbi:hypothetical protein OSL42_17230, partial [Escherichia coli]|nr:hypothetical protein [Escherichia coli]MDA6888262.1 hypothetical protein [Escherichia coli]